MSDMTLAGTTQEEPRTADLLIPGPRKSPDSTPSPGQVVADEAGVDDEGICYPLVRYALDGLEPRGVL